MSTSDHDRRVLWARAHNRCAICRKVLVADASDAGDRESVVGEEAHIVGRSPSGPRGGVPIDSPIDSYDNLILLCRDDHRVVDDQVNEYPAERLRQLKADHEEWAESRFGSDLVPPRLRPDPESKGWRLSRIGSGSELWNLLVGVHAYRLEPPESSEASPEQCDVADAFLDNVKDWGEIAEEISDMGPSRIREATRAMDNDLENLVAHGLVAYAGRRRLILEGGVGPPAYWWELAVKVVPNESTTS